MEKSFGSHSCPFCKDAAREIDYKDLRLITRYIAERGRMTPARVSGLCAKHQREVAKAIKRARFLAFLPFVSEE